MAIASGELLEMRFAKARRRSVSASAWPTGHWRRREFALNPNNDDTIRQVYTHPVSDFSQAIADSDVSSATTRPNPPCM